MQKKVSNAFYLWLVLSCSAHTEISSQKIFFLVILSYFLVQISKHSISEMEKKVSKLSEQKHFILRNILGNN